MTIPVDPIDPKRLLRVFLCHSSQDKSVIREIYQRLRSGGVDPWFDEEDLLPGQDWHLEITKAIRTCDVVLVCLSRNSISKTGYAQKEVKYALDRADEQPEGTVFLIPLRLDDCEVPDRLRKWHWVSLGDPRWDHRLMAALQARAKVLDLAVQSVKEDRSCRLVEVAQKVEELLRRVITEKRLAFAVDVEPALVVAVPFDVAYLTLMTLVVNAIDASAVGGSIRIGSERDGATTLCHVVDHGRGISEHLQQRLFQLGFSTKPGSSGLGLALARHMMTRHRGGVFLSDTGPEGTMMTVRFPSEEALELPHGLEVKRRHEEVQQSRGSWVVEGTLTADGATTATTFTFDGVTTDPHISLQPLTPDAAALLGKCWITTPNLAPGKVSAESEAGKFTVNHPALLSGVIATFRFSVQE